MFIQTCDDWLGQRIEPAEENERELIIMINSIKARVTLNNGVEMPWLGLGLSRVEDGRITIAAVHDALEAGYRSIDTASVYGNEIGVGQALKTCSIPREELFITTKLWNTDQGYDNTLVAFDQSMGKLELEYLDLYLIHWPDEENYKETWRAFLRLYEERRIRAIGVSNFQPHHMDELIKDFGLVPSVNQVEYHPLFTQKPLHDYCKGKGIRLQAWSPLMEGLLMEHADLKEIAALHNKTVAQVMLRWDIQNEVITIPKSTKRLRIIENAAIFDFVLTAEEMARINALNEDRRIR